MERSVDAGRGGRFAVEGRSTRNEVDQTAGSFVQTGRRYRELVDLRIMAAWSIDW